MVNASLPVDKAIDDGCTHLVAVLTRPWGHRDRFNRLLAMWIRYRLRGYSEVYRHAFLREYQTYNAALDLLASGGQRLATWAIAPAPGEFRRRQRRGQRAGLYRAAREGAVRVGRLFGAEPERVKVPELGASLA